MAFTIPRDAREGLIAELERQQATEDNWFTSNRPYALELRGPPQAIPNGSALFVLPLGPEQYMTARQFRQSVRPTLGGIVAEEKGDLWSDITIAGTFGIFPKKTKDTSTSPEPALNGDEALSGPMWFKRLERNVLGEYARLKADPQFSTEVELIWHDTRKDDHWIVVPSVVELRRSAQRRVQYPYGLTLKAIGDAGESDSFLSDAEETMESARSGENIYREVRAGIQKIQAAIDYASKIQGEVRAYVGDAASVTADLVSVVESAGNFVDGLANTISSPRQFIVEVANGLQSMVNTLETAAALPYEVRQNYQSALDGLDQVAAKGVFIRSYEARLGFVTEAERGVERASQASLDDAAASGAPNTSAAMAIESVRSVDSALLDAGVTTSPRLVGNYNSIMEHTLGSADTLESIAATYMGDAAVWYDLVVANELVYPFLSPTGAPGTLAPGDTIAVPVSSSASYPAVGGAEAAAAPLTDLLGTNIRLEERPASRPGRPMVDLAVKKGTNKDVDLIRGEDNLAQALQMRVWTERGSLPSAPSYGQRRLVGFGLAAADITALRVSLRETILADSRVQQVKRYRLEVDGDLVDVSMDVVPIGTSTARNVRSSLT